jgi:hypothetical protein
LVGREPSRFRLIRCSRIQGSDFRPTTLDTREVDMSKKGGNKTKASPKPPMANKGPKKK